MDMNSAASDNEGKTLQLADEESPRRRSIYSHYSDISPEYSGLEQLVAALRASPSANSSADLLPQSPPMAFSNSEEVETRWGHSTAVIEALALGKR